jgi:hypothetical protein
MTDLEYNAMRRRQCDELIPRLFHVYLPVRTFLSDDIETSQTSFAVLFESGHDTYALIVAQKGTSQTLSDVKSMVKHMGLTAQRYFPPHADPDYFYNEGVTHFLKAYPGRKKWAREDITYYQSLAEYPIALVRIANISGQVHRFNRRSGVWQVAFEHSFRKIPVVS